MQLSGSIPALVTPFAHGHVDHDAFHALVQWHVEQGSSAVVVGGTTGESPTLELDELSVLIRTARDAAGGRIPVIAGAGSNGTAHALTLSCVAEAAGADALLHATGYYNKPSPRQLVEHFRAIDGATRLPVLVYDIPARTGIEIGLETMAALAQLERVAGIKDATGQVARVSHQRRRIAKPWSYLSGDDATCLGYVAHGGHGCISVTANVAPALCARMFAHAAQGDFGAARELHDRLMPLHAALFLEPSPAGIKYAMARAGLCREELRGPLLPVEPATRAAIDAALAHAGLA
jgi:4-hydroxy-tetrahydrodipicolinate synthase